MKEKLINYYKIDKEELEIDYKGDIVHFLCENNSEIDLVNPMKEHIIREINNIYDGLTTSFIFNNLSRKDKDMFYDYGDIKDYYYLGEVIKLKKIPQGGEVDEKIKNRIFQ